MARRWKWNCSASLCSAVHKIRRLVCFFFHLRNKKWLLLSIQCNKKKYVLCTRITPNNTKTFQLKMRSISGWCTHILSNISTTILTNFVFILHSHWPHSHCTITKKKHFPISSSFCIYCAAVVALPKCMFSLSQYPLYYYLTFFSS